MPEDVVASEERAFFFEHEAHVVDSVAGGEDCTDGGALGAENLAVFDGVLAAVGLVFVDARRIFGVIGYQVWHAAGVVTVPVGQENVGDVEISVSEERSQVLSP